MCTIYKCALGVLGWVWNIESVRAATGGVRLGCVSLMGRNGEVTERWRNRNGKDSLPSARADYVLGE